MIGGNTFDFNGGPDLQGYWKNYRTNQTVYIKDTILENNNLTGVTRDGRLIDMNQLSGFVKVTEKEANESTPTAPVKTTAAVKQPQVNLDLDKDVYDDVDILTKPLGVRPTQPVQEKPAVNYDPINKILDGAKVGPKVTVSVKWDDFPEGLLFLQKYLDVKTEDIIDAVIQKYVDTAKLAKDVSDSLEKILKSKLTPPETPKEEKPKSKKK